MRTESVLDDQWIVQVERRFYTVMLDLIGPVVPQEVKPQAIGFGSYDFQQLMLQPDELLVVEIALKDTVLNPLAEIQTGFGHQPQSLLPHAVHGRNVISYQYEHRIQRHLRRSLFKTTIELAHFQANGG